MSVQAMAALTFGRPGGDRPVPSRRRPVDLVHLARQTMGDRALEQEVLGLFLQQLSGMCDRMASGDAQVRRTLAHTLKGSARGIGAFGLAECASMIEDDPMSTAHLDQLGDEIAAVRQFVAAINR